MLQTIQNLLAMPIPLWVFGWFVVILGLHDRETRRWIMRIAETVDKMDSDETGWCRHDPVSFVTTDPAEAMARLSERLTATKRKKK